MTSIANSESGLSVRAKLNALLNGTSVLTDPGSSSLAVLGTERLTDGTFGTDPSGIWTLGSGWSWNSGSSRADHAAGTGAISVISIDDGGSGYTASDTITISTGSADATYTATVSSGKVTALTPTNAGGTAYASAAGVATTGGTGTGLVVSILQVADAATLQQAFTTDASAPDLTFLYNYLNMTLTGKSYQLTFTIANYSGGGSVRADVGAGVGNNMYSSRQIAGNGVYSILFTSSDPTVIFTPTADFAGGITNVSVKAITGAPSGLVPIANTDGSVMIEQRPGGIAKSSMFIGKGAGQSYTSQGIADDGYNTGVGFGSLISLLTGTVNVALGNSSLQANTSGSANNAFGFAALGNNISGSNNTAIGRTAMWKNISGGQNVAIGGSALYGGISAGQNVFIGYAAGFAGRTVARDTMIGWNAGLAMTTAADNSGLGYSAGVSCTTGGDNTFVGARSGLLLTTGSQNTLVGSQAGAALTTPNANTIIGRRAGLNLTTGANNTFVGASAGSGITTGSNNTIIGVVTGLSASLASAIILADGANNIRADYGKTTASVWSFVNAMNVASATATPAGGSATARLVFGTTSGFGIYIGSGAPTVSAAQGSIYLRSDGSSTSTRLYVNTNGSTAWTAVTTVA